MRNSRRRRKRSRTWTSPRRSSPSRHPSRPRRSRPSPPKRRRRPSPPRRRSPRRARTPASKPWRRAAARLNAVPVLIGLTGGVAAGKSEALSAFAQHDAATLSTDAVVHELLGEPEVHDGLVDRWGGRVVTDGRIDRGEVGAIVFESPDELRWLEALLHPLVG